MADFGLQAIDIDNTSTLVIPNPGAASGSWRHIIGFGDSRALFVGVALRKINIGDTV